MSVSLGLSSTSKLLCKRLLPVCKALSSQATSVSLAVEFSDPNVQQHLRNITGIDLGKVFHKRKQKLDLPMYNLVTEKQLLKMHEEATERAKELLTIPPVLPMREERGRDIEADPRLDGFDDNKWVFIDISMGKEDKDRYIVVRDTNGTLRDATWEERDRLCQMYNPKPGRSLWLPKLLTPDHLPSVLASGKHLHVLDLVCVQCPPDSEDFIRVHHTVYKHIDKHQLYQDLYSTKHMGGLVWHLLSTGSSLDNLLSSLLKNQQLIEAESLVHLHILCQPTSNFASSLPQITPSQLELIRLFCDHFNYTNAAEIVNELEDVRSQEQSNS